MTALTILTLTIHSFFFAPLIFDDKDQKQMEIPENHISVSESRMLVIPKPPAFSAVPNVSK